MIMPKENYKEFCNKEECKEYKENYPEIDWHFHDIKCRVCTEKLGENNKYIFSKMIGNDDFAEDLSEILVNRNKDNIEVVESGVKIFNTK